MMTKRLRDFPAGAQVFVAYDDTAYLGVRLDDADINGRVRAHVMWSMTPEVIAGSVMYLDQDQHCAETVTVQQVITGPMKPTGSRSVTKTAERPG